MGNGMRLYLMWWFCCCWGVQVCGEEGRVEVELINPLAVPVKIDSLSLHARLTPAAASAPGAPANAAPAAGTGPSHSTSTSTLHAAEQQQQQASAWRPVPTQLVLPGHGKPVKVQLRGTALASGTLTLTGLRVCALGAQWFEPFGLHQHLVRIVHFVPQVKPCCRSTLQQ